MNSARYSYIPRYIPTTIHLPFGGYLDTITLVKQVYLFLPLAVAALAQPVERLTAEREVVGSLSGTRPILRVLKYLRNKSTFFVVQAARSSRGLDDHVKLWSRLQLETEK